MKKTFLLIGLLLAALGVGVWIVRDSPTKRIEILTATDKPAPLPENTPTEITAGATRTPAIIDLAAPSALRSDSGFFVQVVDASGKPVAGVPIVIRNALADNFPFDIYTNTTKAPDGIVRIPHIEQPLPGGKVSTTVVARVAITTFDVVSDPIDLEHLPTQPVKLTIQECGSVVVLMHDSEGTRILPREIQIADKSKVDQEGNFLEYSLSIKDCQMEAGRALFSFVPIGLDLHANAIGDNQSAQANGAGPQKSGEQVTLDMDFGAPFPVLTGRVVDEQSQAIANCEFTAKTSGRSQGRTGIAGVIVHTDERGRFRITLPVIAGPDLTGSLTLRPMSDGVALKSEVRAVLSLHIHAHENELGDLLLRSAQFLAGGRVIDDLGAPVANALVDGDTIRIEGGREVWRNDPQLAGKTGADGAFAIEAPTPDVRFRLRSSRPGYLDGEAVEFIPGASNLSITMTRSSRIAGRVSFNDPALGTMLWASSMRASDTPEQRMLWQKL